MGTVYVEPRYIPLPQSQNTPIAITEFTIRTIGSEIASPTSSIHSYAGHGLSVTDIVTIIVLVTFLTIVLLIALCMLKGWSIKSLIRTLLIESISRKRVGEERCESRYRYYGLARVLREKFVELRRRFGLKISVTPREMATIIGSVKLHRFADVYEDVVYGGINREDVEEVLREM